MADLVGKMLDQGAAEGDVQELHATADAGDRHVALDRAADQRQLELVALGDRVGGLRDGARRRSIEGSMSLPTGQHEAVDPVEERVGAVLELGSGGIISAKPPAGWIAAR